jgi:hypothetical protein
LDAKMNKIESEDDFKITFEYMENMMRNTSTIQSEVRKKKYQKKIMVQES